MDEMDLPRLNLWDCRIRSFDGWTLEVVGGVSSSLQHAPWQILRFEGVSYIECPTAFHHPQIRVATANERTRLCRREAVEPEQTVFVINAETQGQIDAQDFYVVAEGIAVIDCSEQAHSRER